jgi:hypothetical protein
MGFAVIVPCDHSFGLEASVRFGRGFFLQRGRKPGTLFTRWDPLSKGDPFLSALCPPSYSAPVILVLFNIQDKKEEGPK